MAHTVFGYSGLREFQKVILGALDLNGELVMDIKIHIPTDGLATFTVEMALTQEAAEKLLKVDWENAPTRTVIVLEKPEEESVLNKTEKRNC